MGIKKDFLWRIYLTFGFILLFGIAILFQAFKIQVVEGEHWRSLADSLTTAYYPIKADRGNIYSEDGSLMATLLPFFEVRMDVNADALKDDVFYENIDSLALCLANFYKDKPKEAYKSYLVDARKLGKRYLLIRRKVSYIELQEMKTWPLFNKGRYKGGLITIRKNKRVNPFQILAHRTIGYVREGLEPVGLEGRYDEYLSGVEGRRLMQRIAGGVLIPINDDEEIESQNGKDLITTIDIDLQDVAETALMKTMVANDAKYGCVIVMEVKTGKVKAIANLDKNKDGVYWERYNYAVGTKSEPGSTFKLASMIALLEDGKISIDDSVDLENGRKAYYDKVMKDSEHHTHRKVSVKRAFEISSNVGISKLVNKAYGQNPEDFIDAIKSMHLDEITGIEIDGEALPYIKEPNQKNWSGVSLPWMSVGYGVQLSPLQILTLYNAIANNGKIVKPYLVNVIKDYDEVIYEKVPNVSKKPICSEKTLHAVQSLLEGVVENGTARGIKSTNYKIAGKTGTAKIADKKSGYKRIYQASFAGYFPADKPKYSCIVLVDEPSKGRYYGSSVAAPVFKEIADKVFANSTNMYKAVNDEDAFYKDEIPYAKSGSVEDIRSIYNQLGVSNSTEGDIEWAYCAKKDYSMNLMPKDIKDGIVPNVRGMGLRDAVYLLESKGLVVKVTGVGRVRKQSVPGGSRIEKGSIIQIELS